MEYIGILFLDIKVLWRQSKQGKGWSRAERDLSFQQNGCSVCTVEMAEGLWKRLGPLWEIFQKGLVRCTLGLKFLMIVM
jgi:hypothetical protein